jgi:hypothetical protein
MKSGSFTIGISFGMGLMLHESNVCFTTLSSNEWNVITDATPFLFNRSLTWSSNLLRELISSLTSILKA